LHTPKPDLQIGGGYGFISNYSGKESLLEPAANEHRIWQQLVKVQKVSKVKFEHRFRLEQRFLDELYSNRLRYRLLFSVPIGTAPFQAHTFSFHTYNEVFLHDQSKVFDRNRLYAAIGYHLKQKNQIQLGILRQDVGKQHHYYLQMGFTLIH
jgi:hypothetical protein